MEELAFLGWKEGNSRSQIWKYFGKLWPKITEHLKWVFGNGAKILIGSRMMMGFEAHNNNYGDFIQCLNRRGFFFHSAGHQGMVWGDSNLD